MGCAVMLVSDTKQPLLEQGLLGNESINKHHKLKGVCTAFRAAWIRTNRTHRIRTAAWALWRLLNVIREAGEPRHSCSIRQAVVHGISLA